MPIYWRSPPPERCDICLSPIVQSFVDGRTKLSSSWAKMCPRCHNLHGIGLGVGKGQMYIKMHFPDGPKWIKDNNQ